MDDTTNQVVGDDTADATVADNSGVDQANNADDALNADDIQYDDDGNPIDPPSDDEDEEEIELDDLKLKLSKADAEKLKQHVLRQADYTRKTQEAAEQRRALDAERQAFASASEQEISARAEIALIDRQIQAYQNVDWNAAFENDPFEAQKAFAQFQLLERSKNQATESLARATHERTATQQQETARLVQEGAAELARDIPGWSPDLSAKLQDFGARTFGLTKDDFDGVTDPRAVKLLYWAHKGHEAEQASKKVKTIQKQQEVQPAAVAAKKGSAPPVGLDDRLSIDEWNRRREAQLRKKAG